MWENVQCNTGKHDYPKISRDTGKKTLDKWVWIAEGPGIAALKFPALFTWDNVKFRWFLLDSHDNLNITGMFLKSSSKILVDIMSPSSQTSSTNPGVTAAFPQWNWDRKEAGNNNPSRKHWPRLMHEGTQGAAGGQHIPERLLPKSCSRALEAVCAATGCHRGPRHRSCPLAPKTMFASCNHFPHVPAQSYVKEPVFALFKALLGKDAVRPNLHRLLMDQVTTVCSYFAKENTHFPTIKGWHLQWTKSCQILHLLGSKNIHRWTDVSFYKVN